MSAQAVAKQGPWLNDKHRDAVICTFRFRTARHLLAHGQAYAMYKWYLPAANTTDPDVKLAKGLLHKPCSAEDMPAMHDTKQIIQQQMQSKTHQNTFRLEACALLDVIPVRRVRSFELAIGRLIQCTAGFCLPAVERLRCIVNLGHTYSGGSELSR